MVDPESNSTPNFRITLSKHLVHQRNVMTLSVFGQFGYVIRINNTYM